MSVRHHDELSAHIRESEWLKQALLECSNALHEAIALFRVADMSKFEVLTGPDNQKVRKIPPALTEVAAKYNIENISAACKSSMIPPTSMEQMSFLSKCKNVDIPLPPESQADGSDKSGAAGDSLATDICQPVPKSKPPSKGSTMTIIESLMNSALNAEKVLHSFSSARPSYGNAMEEIEDLQAFGIVNAGEAALLGGGGGDGSSVSTPRTGIPDPSMPHGNTNNHCQSMPYPYIQAVDLPADPGSLDLGAGAAAQPSFFKFLQKDNSGSYSLVGKSSMMNYPYINRVTPSGSGANRPGGFIHAPVSSHSDQEDSHNNSSLGILSNVVAAVVSEDAAQQSSSGTSTGSSLHSSGSYRGDSGNKRVRIE